MSSNSVVSVAASRPRGTTARAVRWLYLTVFTSIAVLTWIIQHDGVAFLAALTAANGEAVVVVALVNSLLKTRCGGVPVVPCSKHAGRPRPSA
ncbi:hypothetical protein AB0F52_31085 [Amycolatopsis sp. NPDC024027]|uniref:hypothetical protein n=1 Tax=Amycolatopsis sp. NPDC024027 TaxID=3154327 RepID=UPI0033CCD5FF